MTRWHSPPAELYELVEATPGTVLLESAPPADSHPGAPLTRLFTAPLQICVANTPAELPALFDQIERAVASGRFAAGFFSYECGAFFEPRAAAPVAYDQPTPLAWFGIYAEAHVFDHATGKFPGGNPPGLSQLQVSPATNTPRPMPSAASAGKGGKPEPSLDCTLALTEPEYAARIATVHEFIRAGDVYQINFTVPLRVQAAGSPAALYQRLRARQPVPYCAFLHTQPHSRILSFSPELFFRVENQDESRRITTRPMKGTVPRGRTSDEDRAKALWLCNDPKNRAENVMIVDLLRNDLGRLCQFGSVRAHDLFAVERYPTLWQMTSTVTGQLRPEAGFQEIFRALFPCGSITGAPKIRAMQLIAQLEQRPRGVYTGAIGFFSPQESVFSVAIRTLALDGDQGVMGVGSGVVIDSEPATEFQECLLKAQFLTGSSAQPSPGSFSLIETMLWRDGYPLLDLHLDRLEDSAHYFAFPFNRAEVRAALESHAAGLTTNLRAPSIPKHLAEWVGNRDPQPAAPASKVRLLLYPEGSLKITSEPLPEPITRPLRLRISSDRIDPHDPFYFHKTTHRPLYAHALQAAIAAGFDECLFLNQRGEVTEAANHNLFIEKAGRLYTPPVSCGLLPGVHRRHILATHPNAEERILHIEDLVQADRIYLSNAVRGLREAILNP
jgi:para-aminobenzoate synthetase/4-amino-4-deoxychorismate lyase